MRIKKRRRASDGGDRQASRKAALPPAIANEVRAWTVILESVAWTAIRRGPLAPLLEDVETPIDEFEARVRAHGDFEAVIDAVRASVERFGEGLIDSRIAEALTLRALGVYAPIDPLGLLPLCRGVGSFFTIRDRQDAERMAPQLEPGQIWVRIDRLRRNEADQVLDVRDWAAARLDLPRPRMGRPPGSTDRELDEFADNLDVEASDSDLWVEGCERGVTTSSGPYRQRNDPNGNHDRKQWVRRIRARARDRQEHEARMADAIRRGKRSTIVEGKRVWYEIDPSSGQRIARRPRNWH